MPTNEAEGRRQQAVCRLKIRPNLENAATTATTPGVCEHPKTQKKSILPILGLKIFVYVGSLRMPGC
jgi:hypothetical protein